MILPIVGYGHPKKGGEIITEEYLDLKETITNMYETMYNANGRSCCATSRKGSSFVYN
jgi:peptide deformylase